MDINVKVCDLDPVVGQADVKAYTLIMPDGEREKLDLCRDHAEPLYGLIEKVKAARAAQGVQVSPGSATKTAARTRGRRTVTTLKDLERAKQS